MVILYSEWVCVRSMRSGFIAILFQYIWNNNLWLQPLKTRNDDEIQWDRQAWNEWWSSENREKNNNNIETKYDEVKWTAAAKHNARFWDELHSAFTPNNGKPIDKSTRVNHSKRKCKHKLKLKHSAYAMIYQNSLRNYQYNCMFRQNKKLCKMVFVCITFVHSHVKRSGRQQQCKEEHSKGEFQHVFASIASQSFKKRESIHQANLRCTKFYCAFFCLCAWIIFFFRTDLYRSLIESIGLRLCAKMSFFYLHWHSYSRLVQLALTQI